MRPANGDDRVERIERIVSEALQTLPEPLKGAIDEIIFVVNGKRAGHLYGLFEGVPRGANEAGGPPPQITIYARALAADFPDLVGLRAEVRKTLVHEIGHYLGLEEDELAARGLE